MPPTRLLIVDDVPQVRQELSTLLALAGGIDIVGQAADGVEALCQVEALNPQVVLLDLEMPVMDGYQAAQQIKARRPNCRVVALTVHGYESARQRAVQAGVDAFIIKGAPLESLLQAIRDR